MEKNGRMCAKSSKKVVAVAQKSQFEVRMRGQRQVFASSCVEDEDIKNSAEGKSQDKRGWEVRF